jgi:hypothetical protein
MEIFITTDTASVQRPSVIVQEDNTGTKHPAPLVLNGPSQFLQCVQKLYH